MRIAWPLPGFPDDVAASAGPKLWVAASTATLASEDVWFGSVSATGHSWMVAARYSSSSSAAKLSAGSQSAPSLSSRFTTGPMMRALGAKTPK